MNNYFKKFRETGKIEYYLKYKEEMAKEEVKKENGKHKNKGDSSKRN